MTFSSMPYIIVFFMLFYMHSGDAFQNLQSSFLEKHFAEFDDTEENKFIYSDIHKEYVSRELPCC